MIGAGTVTIGLAALEVGGADRPSYALNREGVRWGCSVGS
jgi:hypothetical protein